MSTGGSSTFFSKTIGATTLASKICTMTPSKITNSAFVSPPAERTNNAGSSVDTMVPKKGTITARPVNTPNASE